MKWHLYRTINKPRFTFGFSFEKLLGCLLALSTPADGKPITILSSLPGSVEKKLQWCLSKRVLVFRNAEIGSYRMTFDPGGRLLAENEVEGKRNLNAILFIELRLDTEHLVILGEAVEARPGRPQPTLVRNPQSVELVTCSIILDVPLDELTFAHAIGLLCRVFLTREEFAPASLGQKSPAH